MLIIIIIIKLKEEKKIDVNKFFDVTEVNHD